MNEPLKVAGYLRINGGDETAHDLQARFLEERLQSHEGWECVGVYFDNAPGSKTCPRPELKRLIADCEAGKINLIVTNNLTTLYRDTSDSLQFVWEMQMLSPPVHIRLENAGIDTRNPQQLLFCMVFNYVIQEKKERAANSRPENEVTANG
jgi:DNA invertase Pin-like site-specific DNA recombinase